jgi:hypothetical protein
MPEWMRKVKPLYWTWIPPIFKNVPETGITESDRNLARELFQLLDEQSQSWYLKSCPWLGEKTFEKTEKSKKFKRGKE